MVKLVTRPSAFAPLIPVDLNGLSGKIWVGSTIASLLLLLATFTGVSGVALVSGEPADECSTPITTYWVVSLLLEALMLLLLTIFVLYIFKTIPPVHIGGAQASDETDILGLVLVLVYLLAAVGTVGMNVTLIAYMVAQTPACIGSVLYASGFWWILISTFTAVLPTRVWMLLFCLPWKKWCDQ